jgi:GTPase
MKPIVGIVGRPNVGKSTLFNRILGYRKAITVDTPGATRDRNYGEVDYGGESFTLVDTGGFEPAKKEGLSPLVNEQISTSIKESKLIIFILDNKEGLLPQDMDIARALKRYGKPVLYVVNKVDSAKSEVHTLEFYRLSPDSLHEVSALHGLGIGDLLDHMIRVLRETHNVSPAPAALMGQVSADRGRVETVSAGVGPRGEGIRIAVVGRPNTGKSSIVNRLIGAERMIVSEEPGTTRDAIDSKVTFGGRELVLVDTAGLRRKSRIAVKVEEYSVASAIKTIERADVVNLVIDAAEGISHQDGEIAHLIITRGKGICIVVNKWDLIDKGGRENEYRGLVKRGIPHASFAPILFASAKTGKNMEKIVETDIKVYGQLGRNIRTPALNKVFREFLQRTSLSYQKGKQVNILYVNQSGSYPPTFLLFANYPRLIPEQYKRYLENSLREEYGFTGAPIRLVFKSKK